MEEGQHLGVMKCNNTCHKMTSQIPLSLLIHYQLNQESCGKRTIILETRKHRRFCADPKEKWVQEAMEHLDSQAAALTQNGGKFERQVGQVTPRTTPATKGLSLSALAEPEATMEGLASVLTVSSQEAQRPMGTSQELPVAVIGSLGTGSPPTSKTQDAGPAAGPQGTGIFKAAAVSTTIWQSSAAYQSGSGLWVEEKATELPSTTAPSTQAPTTLHPTPEENVGSEGQLPWVQGQSPSPEEMNGTHTDAFQNWGPGRTTHPSVAPVSSEGTPSPELVTSGSWAPKVEEPIHATAGPQKLNVLITPVPDSQAATRRQAVGLLAFLGLLFCLGVAMFAYQSFQGCPRKMAGEMVEGLRYVPRSCGSNSYVLVPV
ncbi:fractalkine isoform X2 [Nannospalax galili]|uniref:fractalkine isoform X2 n=1 Tax=Nannospalax galili TaxID=1026970 RepID=UPI00111C260F|nr:fractalkine isoform X2 [Nannospalax galili]